MSTYQLTIPVEFIIEIDDYNVEVDGPPALQGNSALTAVRRAMWALYRQEIAHHNPALFKELNNLKRTLGVKNTLVRGPRQDIDVTEKTP